MRGAVWRDPITWYNGRMGHNDKPGRAAPKSLAYTSAFRHSRCTGLTPHFQGTFPGRDVAVLLRRGSEPVGLSGWGLASPFMLRGSVWLCGGWWLAGRDFGDGLLWVRACLLHPTSSTCVRRTPVIYGNQNNDACILVSLGRPEPGR